MKASLNSKQFKGRTCAGKNRATFPLGPGAGKTFKTVEPAPPIQTTLEFQRMAWHPADFGQRYNIRFVFKPVVPAMVKKPIFE